MRMHNYCLLLAVMLGGTAPCCASLPAMFDFKTKVDGCGA
jgi:hypothetical protein